jgi:tRNA threonylcarbamoyl adenosine modification protein YeaZ/ribosomal-protein-alanine acetyltransferase
MIGLAIEAATEHVEVLVRGASGEPLACEVEDVGHGHTRRLSAMVARALERAAVRPAQLGWVAADLGPGSFTGVRVGLATAEALALASGAMVLGASSLAALALAHGAGRGLVVPLIPAGRRDLYAGFFRAGARGAVSLVAAPRVGPPADMLAAVAETLPALGGTAVHFVGPGAARERETLERTHPGSTEPAVRFDGLSAADLADAALSRGGPRAGLPAPGAEPSPLYVRPAQAEERVRHRATDGDVVALRPMREADLPRIAELEREIFSDPWPESFFLGEMAQPMIHARVAEHDGALAGYSVAWLGGGTGHLGNLAVVPGCRRRGIARRLLVELLERARAQGCEALALEVRVSNFAAQGLYRRHGFRLAGLRRGYYRDTGEDALIMEWRAGSQAAVPSREGGDR